MGGLSKKIGLVTGLTAWSVQELSANAGAASAVAHARGSRFITDEVFLIADGSLCLIF